MAEGLRRLDPTLSSFDLTKKDLKTYPKLQEFLSTHCKSTHCLFSVKECGSDDCEFCTPPRLSPELFNEVHHLPDPMPNGDHYHPFSAVYGTDTSEEQKVTGQHNMPFSPILPSLPKTVK
jgi:hypothetical protein